MTKRNFIAAILSVLLLPLAAATADPKLDANFVASGAVVRTGVVIDSISNTDVGSTIAKLLGVEMQGIEGEALEAILIPQPPYLSVSPSPNRPCPRR